MKIVLVIVLFLGGIIDGISQNLNLRVNEIMAANRAGQFDEFLEFDDWVEIYNPAGSPITNLAGYYISDDPDSLDKWMIPSTDPGLTTILPNGFLALWIDNDFNNLNSQGANHNAGFTLSADGEAFFIVAPDGTTIIDSVTFPVMADDVSYGRVCDGCSEWQYFNNVTFEASNFESQSNALLFINEVQTQNVTTYDDPQHEFDAWFEIFNPNPFQVNLANYYLSTTANPQQWRVPSSNPVRTVIPALSHLLIWCDDDVLDDVNHAPLNLPIENGVITLTGPDGITVVNSYAYSAIPTDQSFGRQSDGASSSIYFQYPTPSVTNQLIRIVPETLWLNEIMTANQTGILDSLGELEDWFEVYNPNSYDVNLSGYYFSDNPERRNKWVVSGTFPDSVTVPAQGWKLFWADGDVEQGVLHADFKLSNNGEYLSLASPDGFTLADEFEWGHINPDTSIGRIQDGAAQWVLFVQSTPEASNGGGVIRVEENHPSTWSAYPIPSSGTIHFTEPITARLYNLRGQLITSFQRSAILDASSMPAGVYLLVRDDGQTKRLVIER
jgi:hypothetical protein